MEKIKLDKNVGDSESFRTAVMNLERKVESESEYRKQNEDDLRKYIESKFLNMHENMKSDEKLSLEREKRMMT